jgi:proteasome lid subunit RPN8/RPN11
MDLTLAPGILEQLITHCRESLPLEACGLVAGRNNLGERFISIKNAAASEHQFEMDLDQLFSTMRTLRESGESLIAICHSHPKGPSSPSTRDIQQAAYPQAAHVIVSLEDPGRPDVRAFRIAEGEALEIGLHVIV